MNTAEPTPSPIERLRQLMRAAADDFGRRTASHTVTVTITGQPPAAIALIRALNTVVHTAAIYHVTKIPTVDTTPRIQLEVTCIIRSER